MKLLEEDGGYDDIESTKIAGLAGEVAIVNWETIGNAAEVGWELLERRRGTRAGFGKAGVVSRDMFFFF